MERSGEDKGLFRSSRAHLAAVGESYFQHLRFALSVGSLMILAGAACLLHGLVPGLCTDSASRTIRKLHSVIEDRPQAGTALGAGEAVGLLTLTLLSLGCAFLPWVMQAGPVGAVPLSLLSLAFPVAAIAASSWGEDEA